jgi:hypothetical protein
MKARGRISFRDRSLDVRGLDAVERGVLGAPEYVEAVSERRGKALAFEETALRRTRRGGR